MRRLALSALMTGLLAECLAAQSAITLPSGQAVTFLEQREDRPEDAIKQLLWAMLTSAEFLTNH